MEEWRKQKPWAEAMISKFDILDYWDVSILIIKKNCISTFLKIQNKYRPILEIFLKRSVLQTKIIFTDHCVVTDLCIPCLKFIVFSIWKTRIGLSKECCQKWNTRLSCLEWIVFTEWKTARECCQKRNVQ